MGIERSFLNFSNGESNQDKLINDIKKSLTNHFDFDTWEDFVDSQNMGDCQLIVSLISNEFGERGVNKVFGEITVDNPSYQWDEIWDNDLEEYREESVENYNFTHHWIEIDGIIYDFSKGTLKDYIDWDDIYDPYIESEKWRY
jgi:hypothetical protein